MDRSTLEILHETLKKLGFPEARVVIEKSTEPLLEGAVIIHIKHQAPQLLIGPGGEHLRALEHIMRCIVNRRQRMPGALTVDINGYRKARRLFLRAVAENTAEQVLLFRRAVALGPMPSQERRIIHVSLTSTHGVRTESAGSEPFRHVVVKPHDAYKIEAGHRESV